MDNITGLVLTLILGAFIGWIASIAMNRNDEQGGFLNIVVGIVGAFLGGALARVFGQDDTRSGNLIDFAVGDLLWAFLGALLLLAVVNLITRRRIR